MIRDTFRPPFNIPLEREPVSRLSGAPAAPNDVLFLEMECSVDHCGTNSAGLKTYGILASCPETVFHDNRYFLVQNSTFNGDLRMLRFPDMDSVDVSLLRKGGSLSLVCANNETDLRFYRTPSNMDDFDCESETHAEWVVRGISHELYVENVTKQIEMLRELLLESADSRY